MPTDCPCGTQQPFNLCCQPYLKGERQAPTPEALMRSRYSAFATKNSDYLVSTHCPTTRPAQLSQQLQQSFENTQWLSLRILSASASSMEHGEVEFVAFFNGDSQIIEQIHERSYFVKTDGLWLYQSGQHLPPIKLERNSPCPCGSGKKYKKCCVR